MTNLLDDRERAAEWAFAHEGEMRFLTHAAALRMLAAHAAGRLGLDQAASDAYAQGLVAASVGGEKDDALIERVRADLEAHGDGETAESLHERLGQFVARAILDAKAVDPV